MAVTLAVRAAQLIHDDRRALESHLDKCAMKFRYWDRGAKACQAENEALIATRRAIEGDRMYLDILGAEIFDKTK